MRRRSPQCHWVACPRNHCIYIWNFDSLMLTISLFTRVSGSMSTISDNRLAVTWGDIVPRACEFARRLKNIVFIFTFGISFAYQQSLSYIYCQLPCSWPSWIHHFIQLLNHRLSFRWSFFVMYTSWWTVCLLPYASVILWLSSWIFNFRFQHNQDFDELY